MESALTTNPELLLLPPLPLLGLLMVMFHLLGAPMCRVPVSMLNTPALRSHSVLTLAPSWKPIIPTVQSGDRGSER